MPRKTERDGENPVLHAKNDQTGRALVEQDAKRLTGAGLNELQPSRGGLGREPSVMISLELPGVAH
jgi:hypothetical protein